MTASSSVEIRDLSSPHRALAVSRVWLIGMVAGRAMHRPPLPTEGRKPAVPVNAAGMRADPPVSVVQTRRDDPRGDGSRGTTRGAAGNASLVVRVPHDACEETSSYW